MTKLFMISLQKGLFVQIEQYLEQKEMNVDDPFNQFMKIADEDDQDMNNEESQDLLEKINKFLQTIKALGTVFVKSQMVIEGNF